MRNFFSGAFKDNRHLSYGFLTGILRIAQESIFSGLNNLTVNSILDETYDKYFGFTRAEVHKMLRDYGALEKEAELKTWYDGYLFGAEEVYNPWSVVNYIAQGCIPKAYWVNTGKNEILEEVLKAATEDVIEKLYALLQGERVGCENRSKCSLPVSAGRTLQYLQSASGCWISENTKKGVADRRIVSV